jgi:carbon monoxide dehydrogenase subunit G
MLHFEGERRFELPVASVYPKLRDAAFLAESIPDASIEGTPTRERALCTVQPGFSFVRGNLDVTLEIVEGEEPARIRVRVSSKGVGSSAEVVGLLQLSGEDAGTKVHWSADIENLGGLLKMVPAGLVRGSAQKVIDDVWNGIAARLT